MIKKWMLAISQDYMVYYTIELDLDFNTLHQNALVERFTLKPFCFMVSLVALVCFRCVHNYNFYIFSCFCFLDSVLVRFVR